MMYDVFFCISTWLRSFVVECHGGKTWIKPTTIPFSKSKRKNRNISASEDTETYIVAGTTVDEMQSLMDDHIIKVQTMKGRDSVCPWMREMGIGRVYKNTMKWMSLRRLSTVAAHFGLTKHLSSLVVVPFWSWRCSFLDSMGFKSMVTHQ